jgi:ABC-type transport system substrate-binding protein
VFSRIENGQADWGGAPSQLYFDPERKFVAKYGVNKGQFHVSPGLALRGYALNASRPLFRNNVALRQAVNFAVDRRELVRVGGNGSLLSGRRTDQYLPPSIPGFRDARIYPLDGPNLRKARSLARGHTRGGKAVLWTLAVPPLIAAGQVLKRNLRQIGLDVAVKALPPQAFISRVGRPNAAFDIAFIDFGADYIDPFSFTNLFFDSRFIGQGNSSHFSSPKYDRLLRRAASLQGEARYRAYGQLDVRLARDAAPMVAVAYGNLAALVSKRVGCIVLNFTVLDLAAACLK